VADGVAAKKMATDRRDDEANDHTKGKAEKRSNRYSRTWKAYGMSAFLFLMVFVITGILFSVAIASWQKGSFLSALIWGLAGYMFFGLGAVLAYYYYIIKPSHESSDSSRDRPYVFFESVRLEKPLTVGDKPVIILGLKNSGMIETSGFVKDFCYAYRPVPLDAPSLPYYSGKTIPFSIAPTGGTTIRFCPDFVLTDEFIQSVKDGKMIVFFYARGEYKGSKGRVYPLPFCMQYDNDMPGNFINCDESVRFEEQ
jgi:hypothetical protein